MGELVLTLTWYMYMCLPFKVLFCKFWHSGRGVFITDEDAQFTKKCVYFKKHNHLSDLVVFCTKFVYRWVVNGDKKRYSKSQNFEVQQVHAHTKNF